MIASGHHYNIKSNSTVTSTAKESNCMAAASSHKTHQRASPNRCNSGGGGRSGSTDSEQYDSPQNELSDEAGSSKFHNFKNHSQRKRRSSRRPITSTKMPHDSMDDAMSFGGTIKKRKDSASSSLVASQSDTQSSLAPSSEFYHSLLVSSYSDSLNGK